MEKIYYSITEVSEMFGITQSNLRFWEKEFKQLRPHRTPKGIRSYTNEDIQLVKQIIYLVNEQKLTLDGARRKLTEKKDDVAKMQELSERLKSVRSELSGILQSL